MSETLARICADKRVFVAARKIKTPLSDIEARARAAEPTLVLHRALEERAAYFI